MVFVKIFLFIFLVSCSNLTSVNNRDVASKDSSGSNCHDAVEKIYDDESTGLSQWLSNSSKKTDVKSYQKKVLDLNLSIEEKILLKKELVKAPNNIRDIKKLYLYLLWSRRFFKEKRLKAIKEVAFLYNDEQPSDYIKKFQKSQKNFKKDKEKKIEKFKKSNPKRDLTKISKELDVKQEMRYLCRSTELNNANKQALKRYMKFVLFAAPISTTTTFTFANREELVDGIEERDEKVIKGWFAKLGYEVVIMSALNILLSKFIAEPTGGYFSKVIKSMMSESIFITTDASLYNVLFKPSNDVLNLKYDEIINSDEYQKMLRDLHKIVEKKTNYQLLKEKVFSGVLSFFGKEYNGYDISDLVKENISKEDLEKEEVKDAILKALALSIYLESREESGNVMQDLIRTGSKGEDRFLFFVQVAPIYHSLNVAVAGMIYYNLCINHANPTRGFANAALIYSLWSFGYNFFEYGLREYQIGQ